MPRNNILLKKKKEEKEEQKKEKKEGEEEKERRRALSFGNKEKRGASKKWHSNVYYGFTFFTFRSSYPLLGNLFFSKKRNSCLSVPWVTCLPAPANPANILTPSLFT